MDDYHHRIYAWHSGRLVDLSPQEALDLAKHLTDAAQPADSCRCGHRYACTPGDLCTFCYRAAERITERTP